MISETNYFLGVDIGTTSTKVIAFAADGHILVQHQKGYPIQHPQPDWSEQDPDEILQVVLELIALVQAETRLQATLQGLSFSAAMHSLMAVDIAGKPLTQLMIWADNRSASTADALRNSAQGMSVYQATGTPIHAMTPLCKLAWLRDHQPGLFPQAHKFIGIKEYIVYYLTGRYAVDHSIASATGLFDIHTFDWNPQALRVAGIATAQLSDLVSIFHKEYLLPGVAAQLGIATTVPLVIGASDGCLANVGAGAVAPDRLSVTIGTSGAVRTGIPQPWTDAHMRTFCYVLTSDLFIAGGGMNNGGIIAEWLHQNFFPEIANFEDLIPLAETIPPGSDGLVFLPYLLGERAPVYNAHAKGVYFGITIQHTQAHFVRATLEGIALAIYHTGKALLDEFPGLATLYVSGGLARSAFVVQLLADVYGKKTLVTETVESSAYGAVIVGWKALGLLEGWPTATPADIPQEAEPDMQKHQVYQQLFARYTRLYHALQSEFAEK
jgi:gluconokinase